MVPFERRFFWPLPTLFVVPFASFFALDHPLIIFLLMKKNNNSSKIIVTKEE